MKLAYKKIDAFEVNGITFRVQSTWNGLEEWVDGKGRKLIVARQAGAAAEGFAHAFFSIFVDVVGGDLVVLSASPDLLVELQEAS